MTKTSETTAGAAAVLHAEACTAPGGGGGRVIGGRQAAVPRTVCAKNRT